VGICKYFERGEKVFGFGHIYQLQYTPSVYLHGVVLIEQGYAFMAWNLVQHRENFTYIYTSYL
jgi:hypothetical protein